MKNQVILKGLIYRSAYEYLWNEGFIGIPYEGITNATGSCEAVSNVFKLDEPDFRTLTQTVQLHLERDIIRHNLPRMFSCNRSYRKDNKNWKSDGRHSNDFSLLESEALDTDLVWLLKHCNDLLSHIFKNTLNVSSRYGLLTPKQHSELYYYYEKGFKVISYTDAIALLNIPFGTDLSSKEEQFLVNHFDQNLMITHYPESIKFFNMLLTRDCDKSRQTVDCVDVVLKHSGESIGGSVREWDHDIIKDRLDNGIMMKQLKEMKQAHDGKPEEVEQMFAEYLALFKNNPVKRSGMGMGFGRVAQFILGSDEIVPF
jgi:aspartyl/asparaginyl-tRNA synthetase